LDRVVVSEEEVPGKFEQAPAPDRFRREGEDLNERYEDVAQFLAEVCADRLATVCL
jgi:hypothetical protein